MKNSLPFLIVLLTFSSVLAMEEFSYRLMYTNPEQIEECDDKDRWISLKHEDFLLLCNNAQKQNIPNKKEFMNLASKILDGTIKSANKEVLLTQKEFFGGLIQYLPWNGKLFFSPNTMPLLLNNQGFLLTLGNNNFWKPNDVRITQQP